MRWEEICELLQHESTSKFSDFTESENSNEEVDDHAIADSILKDIDDAASVADILMSDPIQPSNNNFLGKNMQNYDGVCEVFRKL